MKLNVYNIISKQAIERQGSKGPYTIYQFQVNAVIDGQQYPNVTLKTFNKDQANSVKAGIDIDVDKEDYKGFISYMIKKPVKSYSSGGRGKPTYTIEEYTNLFWYTVNEVSKVFTDKDSEAFQKMVSTFLIGAYNTGAKVAEKTEQQEVQK